LGHSPFEAASALGRRATRLKHGARVRASRRLRRLHRGFNANQPALKAGHGPGPRKKLRAGVQLISDSGMLLQRFCGPLLNMGATAAGQTRPLPFALRTVQEATLTIKQAHRLPIPAPRRRIGK